MSYQYYSEFNAASYTPGRGGQPIRKIIIHHWGADGQTFEGVCAWFENPQCPTSAHYVVEAGRVACMVELCDTAYHAGVWEHNQDSIGIECRPEMSKGDLETVCELVAELFQTYGVMPVIGHCDVYATACPGRYYDKLDYIYNRALEIMNQGEQEEVEDDWMSEFSKEDLKYLHTLCENHKAKECSDWAKEEMKAAIKAGITDGTRPLDAVTRQEAACMALRGNVTK